MPNNTYDLSTPVGRVRFHIADNKTDAFGVYAPAAAIFTDAELLYALFLGNNNVLLAGAYALESLAANRARTASLVRTGNTTRDMNGVANSLAARARELRDLAASQMTLADIYGAAGAGGPDVVFTPTTGGGDFPGTMEGW